MPSVWGPALHVSREVVHQLLHGDGTARTGNISLVDQLRGHDIRYFGQCSRDALLAQDGLTEFIDVGVEVAKREWECVHGVPWVGEDNHLHDTWVTWDAMPDWVRKALIVPRCMNTVSFLVFMVLDLLLYVGVLRVVRRLLRDTRSVYIRRNMDTIESVCGYHSVQGVF